MGLFGSVSENDAFVILIEIAREDAGMRRKLLNILKQNRFNRESILNTFVKEMVMTGAPSDLIAALAYLKNDNVAKEALRLIKEI